MWFCNAHVASTIVEACWAPGINRPTTYSSSLYVTYFFKIRRKRERWQLETWCLSLDSGWPEYDQCIIAVVCGNALSASKTCGRLVLVPGSTGRQQIQGVVSEGGGLTAAAKHGGQC